MTITRVNPVPERQVISQSNWIFIGNGTSAMLQIPQVTVSGYDIVSCPFVIPKKWRPQCSVISALVTHTPNATQKAYLRCQEDGAVYVQGWGGSGGTVVGNLTWTL